MKHLLHFWFLFITGIKRIKASKAFHLAALASPLLFLYAFAGNLSQDIMFPVVLKQDHLSETAIESGNSKGTRQSHYTDYLSHYTNPSGIPYFSIIETTRTGYPSIIIKEDIEVDDKVTGDFQLIIPSINTNVTKNYQNRLTGSIAAFLNKTQPEKFISITEKPLYKTEPSWMQFFSVTILILGLWLSGMLFGSLSFSTEYQHNLILFYRLSPGSIAIPLSGKLMAGFFKSTLVLCFYLLISSFMGIVLVPEAVLSLVVFCLITMSALSLGMIIGMICGEVIIAFIASLIGAILLWITGGGFGTSMAVLPVLRYITEFNPLSWCVRLAQHLFFSGPFYVNDIIFLSGFTLIALAGLVFTYKKLIHVPGGGAGK